MSAPARPLTLVTGGSRGIGAATVLHLAAHGHDVVVGYRSGASEAAGVVAAAGARGELGPVTGLVANAGLTAHLGDLADTPVDVIRQVLDVDLLGVVLCARRAAQVLSRRRGGAGGSIVAVSSSAATLGAPHEYVHHAAAKAGVDASSSAWRRNWRTTACG